MEKRLLILFGSPKTNGATANAVRDFVAQIPKGVSIKEYRAFDMRPMPCIDCGYCKTKNGCTFHDLDSFFLDFEQADYVVVASPVYNQSFPSPLKAVLERTQRYYNLRFTQGVRGAIKKPRKCALIAVSGNEEEQAYNHMASMLEQALTVLNGELVSTLIVRNTDRDTGPLDPLAVKSFAIKLLLS